ncbi:hypothetical protein Hamer_G006730 [Homarus americanus]|uniref:Uncharacterized protein n=1 Tax=Homarus americanus TaxID=6706 RepID=A0A8J5JLT5_HOMAM|nr:hypothetical protein Hamer_G006730 [Homarus americanus]
MICIAYGCYGLRLKPTIGHTHSKPHPHRATCSLYHTHPGPHAARAMAIPTLGHTRRATPTMGNTSGGGSLRI